MKSVGGGGVETPVVGPLVFGATLVKSQIETLSSESGEFVCRPFIITFFSIRQNLASHT